MKYFSTKSRGFTLIELLLVIVIIGILAGLVLAVINPARQQRKSREAILKSNTNKICFALFTCASSAQDISLCNDFSASKVAVDITELRGAAQTGPTQPASSRSATSIPGYSTYNMTETADTITITGNLPGTGAGSSGAAGSCDFTCSYNFLTGDAQSIQTGSGCL